MSKFVVAPVNEIPPGTRVSVKIGGRAVAVFNAGGQFYAVRDVCPHQGAPLSRGVLVGELTACRPGEYSFHSDRPHVKCPWHGWEYDLATGQSTYDPAHDRVRSYDVSVEGGGTVLENGRVTGPYTVETLSVVVEDDYVVIET
jgi:3-phenylpropionate/trans-cinnamate dioxygenase ferredoxin subunit